MCPSPVQDAITFHAKISPAPARLRIANRRQRGINKPLVTIAKIARPNMMRTKRIKPVANSPCISLAPFLLSCRLKGRRRRQSPVIWLKPWICPKRTCLEPKTLKDTTARILWILGFSTPTIMMIFLGRRLIVILRVPQGQTLGRFNVTKSIPSPFLGNIP